MNEGQYNQSYNYNLATGYLGSKSDVSAYTYSSLKSHVINQGRPNTYRYNLNINLISRADDRRGFGQVQRPHGAESG